MFLLLRECAQTSCSRIETCGEDICTESFAESNQFLVFCLEMCGVPLVLRKFMRVFVSLGRELFYKLRDLAFINSTKNSSEQFTVHCNNVQQCISNTLLNDS